MSTATFPAINIASSMASPIVKLTVKSTKPPKSNQKQLVYNINKQVKD